MSRVKDTKNNFRINGFEQIKAFYAWVFNNPDKARPTHISLYLFLINQGNRANWVEWFKCPYDLAMQGACIGNKGTYYKCLGDLQLWGLINYKRGINSHMTPQINLIQLYKSEPLSEQVTVPLPGPLPVPLTVPLPGPLPVPIYKLLTSNLKLITDNIEDVLEFLKGKEKKHPKGYETFIDKFNEVKKSRFEYKDTKAIRQYHALIKAGYTTDQMITALQNFMKDQYHLDTAFKHLTPEFVTRSDKIEKGLNMECGPHNGTVDF